MIGYARPHPTGFAVAVSKKGVLGYPDAFGSREVISLHKEIAP